MVCSHAVEPVLDAFAQWVRESPGLAMLLITCVPLSLVVWSEWADARRRRAAPADAPASPVEPEAAAEAIAALPIPETVEIPAGSEASRPIPETLEEPPAAVGLFQRLRRTREALVDRIGEALAGRSLDTEVVEEIEAHLYAADLGVQTAESLLDALRKAGGDASAAEVREILRAILLEKLRSVEPGDDPLTLQASPHVVLVLGVNGSGKTTSIGKLASRHQARGRKVLLGAADTFRAAATEQLQVWGERVGCPVVTGRFEADPASVAFDSVKAGIEQGCDVVLIDTAGRLQTRKPLMDELGKISRVIGRALDGAPHETLLVLDANTGQNAISQTRLFAEVTPVSGLVLTKLDGTARGGVLVGLADEFGIPVKYIGVGESVEDLRDFSAAEFVDALFGAPD